MNIQLSDEEVRLILDGLNNLEFETEDIVNDTREVLRETGEILEPHRTVGDKYTYNDLNLMVKRLSKIKKLENKMMFL